MIDANNSGIILAGGRSCTVQRVMICWHSGKHSLPLLCTHHTQGPGRTPAYLLVLVSMSDWGPLSPVSGVTADHSPMSLASHLIRAGATLWRVFATRASWLDNNTWEKLSYVLICILIISIISQSPYYFDLAGVSNLALNHSFAFACQIKV